MSITNSCVIHNPMSCLCSVTSGVELDEARVMFEELLWKERFLPLSNAILKLFFIISYLEQTPR